jgi:hypothetical protein
MRHVWQRGKVPTELRWGEFSERDHLEDQDNIRMNLKNRVGVDWINLAQDRERWWALLYTVMNLRFP